MNCENNTKLFYKELNGNCNSTTLLEIARKGIFLYEPLFNNDKIKNDENVIEISVLAGQYFMVLNKNQYMKLIDLSFQKEKYDIYPFQGSDCIFSLVIINKYLLKQLMNKKNEEFLLNIINYVDSEFLLFYLYKFKYVSTKIFYSFFTDELKESVFNLRFEVFEYFYHKKYKVLLTNTIKNSDIYIKCRILIHMLEEYGRDVKIFKYCIKIIKKFNLYMNEEDFRVPLHFPLSFLEKYTNKIYIPNQLFMTCDDKNLERFINIVFSDSLMDNLKYNYHRTEQLDKHYLKYNIDINHLNNYKIKNKNLNLENIYNSETFKLYLKGRDNFEGFKYNTRDKIISLINISNEKYKYFNVEETRNLYYINIHNLNFVQKYLNNYDEIEKILNNPEYLLIQPFDISSYEQSIMNICCLISLAHNNYNSFIIKVLLHTCLPSFMIKYYDRKFIFLENYCRYTHTKNIFKVLKSTPHTLFNSYLIIDHIY